MILFAIDLLFNNNPKEGFGMGKEMFATQVTSVAPQRKRRYAIALALAVPFYVFIVATMVVAPLFATNELPNVYRDALYVLKVEAVPPPPPPSPPVVKTPIKVPTNAPNPNAAPVEAPDKIVPEPVDPPKWSPPTTTECLTCVPGGTGPPTTGLPPVVGLPPPPPSPPQKPLRISDSQAPKPIVRINPIYPTIAQSARIEGVVVIEATINIQGDVENAKILRGHPLLNEAALSAVRQWKYVPYKLNGEPIPITITVTVNFTLR
jgi:protein TonB